MIIFAAIGFLLAVFFGAYLAYGGFNLLRASLAFRGTIKSVEGVISILLVIVGIAIIATAIYFSPFQVSVSA